MDPEVNQAFQPSFSELIEVIGDLASEVENAKMVSRGQINVLESQLADLESQLTETKARFYSLMEQKEEEIRSLKDERDEAIRSLSAVTLEKDQLLLQLSGLLRKQLDEQKKNDEARLALLQLRQVQEELEHYFIVVRQQSELLEANEDLCARFTALLANAKVTS